MKIKRSFGEKLFDWSNILFLCLIGITVIIPVMHIVAASLSESPALMRGEIKLWPVGFNLDNYYLVVRNVVFLNSFKITTFLILVGTVINLFLTFITAYPLSRPGLKGRKLLMFGVVFTLLFQTPVIPTYLIVKGLGLLNTIWSMIIPGAISAFNLIICITFFKSSIPQDLIDAAKVDGMTEYGILWRIVMPLSKPIAMTLLLFYSVHYWNSYYSAILYISDHKLRPLQMYLYQMLSQGDVSDALVGAVESMNTTPRGITSATIVVATVPIVAMYPFIQKYFVKGAMLGSLKG